MLFPASDGTQVEIPVHYEPWANTYNSDLPEDNDAWVIGNADSVAQAFQYGLLNMELIDSKAAAAKAAQDQKTLQLQTAAWVKANGGIPFIVQIGDQIFAPGGGPLHPGWTYYNAGNGVGAFVPTHGPGDVVPVNPVFIAPPQHNTGFFDSETWTDAAREMRGGIMIVLTAVTAGAAAAWADAIVAGVGTTASTATVAEGSAAFVGDIPLAGEGGTSIYAAGEGAAEGAAVTSENVASATVAHDSIATQLADTPALDADAAANLQPDIDTLANESQNAADALDTAPPETPPADPGSPPPDPGTQPPSTLDRLKQAMDIAGKAKAALQLLQKAQHASSAPASYNASKQQLATNYQKLVASIDRQAHADPAKVDALYAADNTRAGFGLAAALLIGVLQRQ